MEKIINQWILVVIMAGFSLSAFAYGDDTKKTNSKKSIHLSPFHKKPTTISKKDQEDTLVYDKSLEDTLTFGDGKTLEDTLIFADDEKQLLNKPNNNSSDFSLLALSKSVSLNPVIYPNPSLGEATLELNSSNSLTTEIVITSQDGTVIKREFTKDKSYELTNLAAGKYIVTIKNGNQTAQKRLFVK